MPSVIRDLLSSHSTIAVYQGLEAGREPLLRIHPPQPAKVWAVFSIESYLPEGYSKPGKYGDEKCERFAFVPDEAEQDIQSTLKTLAAGSRVRLDWVHEYVTVKDDEGRSNSSPERPVKLLEVIP